MKKIFLSLLMGLTVMLGGCEEKANTNRIYVFSQPGCQHCTHAKNYMDRYYKDYDIKEMNIREGSNMSYMLRYARRYKIPEANLGTPLIIMGNNYVMGWGTEQMHEFNRYAKDFSPKKKTEGH